MSSADCDAVMTAFDEFCTVARRHVDDYSNSVNTLDKIKDAVEAKKRSVEVLKELAWDSKEIQSHIESIDEAIRHESDKFNAESDGITAKRRDIDNLYSVVDELAHKFKSFQQELQQVRPASKTASTTNPSDVGGKQTDNSSSFELRGDSGSILQAVLKALQTTQADISRRAKIPEEENDEASELRKMRKLYML